MQFCFCQKKKKKKNNRILPGIFCSRLFGSSSKDKQPNSRQNLMRKFHSLLLVDSFFCSPFCLYTIKRKLFRQCYNQILFFLANSITHSVPVCCTTFPSTPSPNFYTSRVQHSVFTGFIFFFDFRFYFFFLSSSSFFFSSLSQIY